MFSFLGIFRDKNENYLTRNVIDDFMVANKIKYTTSDLREDRIKLIEIFGNESEENKEIVLSWLDTITAEGIKDVYVRHYPLLSTTQALLENQDAAMSHFNESISDGIIPHLCSNTYGEELSLVSVRWEGEEQKIVFTYCKKLFAYETKGDTRTTKTVDYPIIAEFYVKSQYLLVIAKPKTDLYKYSTNGFDPAKPTSRTNIKHEIAEVLRQINILLPADKTVNIPKATKNLKTRLFYLIDKFTGTPEEIQAIMSSNEEQLDTITNTLANICHVQGKNRSPDLAKIKYDIATIVEKHISINWNNHSIFTQGRKAYPTKLNSTDNEDTNVQQTATESTSLQTKSAFFDNKKTLYANKSCDGADFIWARKKSWYTDTDFPVRISVGKGEIIFKFMKYTAKEDMDDVIFSVIGEDANTTKP